MPLTAECIPAHCFSLIRYFLFRPHPSKRSFSYHHSLPVLNPSPFPHIVMTDQSPYSAGLTGWTYGHSSTQASEKDVIWHMFSSRRPSAKQCWAGVCATYVCCCHTCKRVWDGVSGRNREQAAPISWRRLLLSRYINSSTPAFKSSNAF